ncbi:hypothetical protein [Gluconobacter roseus]|uniref:Uncharacterized protein n=1 Tax=Gluconobacter roseus NBRC 3990 TaxID=1307950 RepID=A0A4Y3M6D1_9PROT|nr:hypothetical protein [Gluconobacter roseus]KXV44187.1 hypothetical protein AD943_05590 [Gluconobacter roseus]GBR45433.1 hypothetical protein AA3990_1089 [Gluconobacter roseus NBRC 3990]GEB02968.1 hypothetical protein GRO01_05440 [Gluconobacter roseus NBRC 3990]GLP93426.1 hypothetical protein GCM10007871_14040 [Gluconobacter roseus NBRC 3990]
MSNDHAPHESSSLHHLAEKAHRQPKLLMKSEVEELAHFVLKGAEGATEEQKEIAKRALHNPEGVESSDITALATQILTRK